MIEILIVTGIVALLSSTKNGAEDAIDEANASSRRYETPAQRQNRERETREALKANMPTKSGCGWL